MAQLIVAAAAAAALASPNGAITFELAVDAAKHPVYSIALDEQAVIDESRLGIVVDGKDVAAGTTPGKRDPYRIDERFRWWGAHREAVARCRGERIAFGAWTLDVRACNDGVAFRYVVPASSASVDAERTPDEGTVFRVPAGSTVWTHDFEGHYEGVHVRRAIENVAAGDWAAPPLTIQLPAKTGYASITESAIAGYAGMGLRGDGQRGFVARLGHEEPVSYPFRLRYKPDDIERLSKPARIRGTITTPWRVVIVGRTLNDLVNADIVRSVAPAPDRTLFADQSWIRPGRAVWRFLDGGENTLDGLKQFTAMAERLGFEYHVVEGIWQRWSPDELRGFVDDAKQHHVGIWLWKNSRDLATVEQQRAFFDLCRDLGVVGAKIDFFDHEAREMIDRYQSILRESAAHHVMVDFHGANKPAGEARTWPHELTREGVYGLEHRQAESWGRHNTTLPFTRFLAGAGDYTPVVFGERRKETSWAHQIATAAIFTSPLLVYGSHPQALLDNPAVELIKSIPSVWDETIVLPASEIGEVAAFARRSGRNWFLAVANGPNARTLTIDLSFLGTADYDAQFVRDRADDAAAVDVERGTAKRGTPVNVTLRAGGGFVARFVSRD